MKRLIIRILVMLALVVVTVQVFSYRIRSTGYDLYQPYHDHFAPLAKNRTDIRAISLGNSHSQAIDFETLELRGYHLWLSGGDLFEVDHLIRSVLPNTPNLGIVLINISYFSYNYDNAALEERQPRRKWLYAGTPSWRFIQGDREAFITGKLNIWTGIDTVLRTSEGKLYKAIIGANGFESQLERRPDGQRLYGPYIDCEHAGSYNTVTQDAKRVVKRHMNFSRKMQIAHPNIRDDTVKTLADLLAFLEKRDIKVVLYIPPYFAAYNELYKKTIALETRKITQQLARDYDALYVDYSSHSGYINDRTIFYNADHLNLCGARKFSHALAAEIESHYVSSQ